MDLFAFISTLFLFLFSLLLFFVAAGEGLVVVFVICWLWPADVMVMIELVSLLDRG